MLADLCEDLELPVARLRPELRSNAEPAVAIDDLDLVEHDCCKLPAQAPRPRLGRVTGPLLVVPAAHRDPSRLRDCHGRPLRVGVVVVKDEWMGVGRPDARWAPFVRAGNRRASSLPGHRDVIAMSGGTGAAVEDRPGSQCVGMWSMPVPVEPDAVLVLRPCAIATLDLMAPRRGSMPVAGGRRRGVCHQIPDVADEDPDSITCASTQVSGTIAGIAVIQE